MTKNKLKEIVKRVQQDPKFKEIFSSDWRQPIKSKPSKPKEKANDQHQ